MSKKLPCDRGGELAQKAASETPGEAHLRRSAGVAWDRSVDFEREMDRGVVEAASLWRSRVEQRTYRVTGG
jgi:hypothetical protein